VYEAAQRLDLAICVHTGAGSPAIASVFDVTRSHTFPHTRTLPLMAFRNLVANKVPERFPTLRFGFIEAGASWVPYVLHALRGVFGGEPERWGPALFRDYRFYCSYEEWEDLPYLLRHAGGAQALELVVTQVQDRTQVQDPTQVQDRATDIIEVHAHRLAWRHRAELRDIHLAVSRADRTILREAFIRNRSPGESRDRPVSFSSG